MARGKKNKIARGSRDQLSSAEIPAEELRDIEKRLQAKARAMQAAGISLSVAAKTSNILVDELMSERAGRANSEGNAAPH